MEDKTRLGFRALRGVGDLGWLEEEGWEESQSYEEKAHEWIRNVQMTAICAYPIQHCTIRQTKDVLDHHDRIFQGHPKL